MVQVLAEARIFFSFVKNPDSNLMDSGTVPLEVKERGMGLTTHLQLMLRIGMNEALTPLPHMPLWHAHGQNLIFLI